MLQVADMALRGGQTRHRAAMDAGRAGSMTEMLLLVKRHRDPILVDPCGDTYLACSIM